MKNILPILLGIGLIMGARADNPTLIYEDNTTITNTAGGSSPLGVHRLKVIGGTGSGGITNQITDGASAVALTTNGVIKLTFPDWSRGIELYWTNGAYQGGLVIGHHGTGMLLVPSLDGSAPTIANTPDTFWNLQGHALSSRARDGYAFADGNGANLIITSHGNPNSISLGSTATTATNDNVYILGNLKRVSAGGASTNNYVASSTTSFVVPLQINPDWSEAGGTVSNIIANLDFSTFTATNSILTWSVFTATNQLQDVYRGAHWQIPANVQSFGATAFVVRVYTSVTGATSNKVDLLITDPITYRTFSTNGLVSSSPNTWTPYYILAAGTMFTNGYAGQTLQWRADFSSGYSCTVAVDSAITVNAQ